MAAADTATTAAAGATIGGDGYDFDGMGKCTRLESDAEVESERSK